MHHADRRGAGRGIPLTPRAAVLIAGALTALGLALALYATRGADPAEAYERNVCSHRDTSIHRGPEGRYHGMVFEGSWNTHNGSFTQHWHRNSHWTKRDGRYRHDWTRTYRCFHPVNAVVDAAEPVGEPSREREMTPREARELLTAAEREQRGNEHYTREQHAHEHGAHSHGHNHGHPDAGRGGTGS